MRAARAEHGRGMSEENFDDLVRTIALASHRRSGSLAVDDLMQIARIAVARALASHDGRTDGVRSYVAQAIRWRIHDAYREQAHEPRPRRAVEELDQAASLLSRPDFTDGSVRRLDLQRAMRQLRPDYRRVLFDVQVLDRPYSEVACERGITVGAAKALHHRALEQLRRFEAEAEAA